MRMNLDFGNISFGSGPVDIEAGEFDYTDYLETSQELLFDSLELERQADVISKYLVAAHDAQAMPPELQTALAARFDTSTEGLGTKIVDALKAALRAFIGVLSRIKAAISKLLRLDPKRKARTEKVKRASETVLNTRKGQSFRYNVRLLRINTIEPGGRARKLISDTLIDKNALVGTSADGEAALTELKAMGSNSTVTAYCTVKSDGTLERPPLLNQQLQQLSAGALLTEYKSLETEVDKLQIHDCDLKNMLFLYDSAKKRTEDLFKQASKEPEKAGAIASQFELVKTIAACAKGVTMDRDDVMNALMQWYTEIDGLLQKVEGRS